MGSDLVSTFCCSRIDINHSAAGAAPSSPHSLAASLQAWGRSSSKAVHLSWVGTGLFLLHHSYHFFHLDSVSSLLLNLFTWLSFISCRSTWHKCEFVSVFIFPMSLQQIDSCLPLKYSWHGQWTWTWSWLCSIYGLCDFFMYKNKVMHPLILFFSFLFSCFLSFFPRVYKPCHHLLNSRTYTHLHPDVLFFSIMTMCGLNPSELSRHHSLQLT